MLSYLFIIGGILIGGRPGLPAPPGYAYKESYAKFSQSLSPWSIWTLDFMIFY